MGIIIDYPLLVNNDNNKTFWNNDLRLRRTENIKKWVDLVEKKEEKKSFVLPKDGQDCDGVSGWNECPEVEVVDEGDVVEVRDELTNPVHEPANAEGGNGGTDESKRENGAKISKKVALFHRVAGMEDYWGKKNVEEYFGIKRCLFVDLRVDIFYFS